MVSEFWKRLFNATVYMEFRVCFTIAKYETISCRYVRQSMCLLMLFSYSKIHFQQLGPFQLIITVLKSLDILLGLSPVWNRYPKGSPRKWLPSVQ